MAICGLDLNFLALRGELQNLKKEAMGLLLATAADAADALGAQMISFEDTLREWIPFLPDLPPFAGTPMLTQLITLAGTAQAIADDPEQAKQIGLTLAFEAARDAFNILYSDALAKYGLDVDYLITNLNSGIDPCSLVPNIVIDATGTVKDLVKIPLYAKVDPEPEEPSVETPVMKALRGKIDADLGDTISGLETYASAYASKLSSVTSEVGNIKEALNVPEISREDYYNVVTKTLNEISETVVDDGHPAVAKLVLDNIRQGSSLI